MAVGLSAAPTGVSSFGAELVVYWREASVGHNTLAYFIGKSFSNFYRILVGAVHFCGFYLVLAETILTPGQLYSIVLVSEGLAPAPYHWGATPPSPYPPTRRPTDPPSSPKLTKPPNPAHPGHVFRRIRYGVCHLDDAPHRDGQPHRRRARPAHPGLRRVRA